MDGRTDSQTDGQNCDGLDALEAVAAFARKRNRETDSLWETVR